MIMSRYTQDIPIRPRYGISECQEMDNSKESSSDKKFDNITDEKKNKNKKTWGSTNLESGQGSEWSDSREEPGQDIENSSNDETVNSNDLMRHYVAGSLADELRIQSFQCNTEDEQNTLNAIASTSLPKTATVTNEIKGNILSDIEIETQYLATSVDNLFENLCNLLHSISSITADTVEVYRNSVNKLTDSMDANIKSMYTIMAKTEEITKSMPPTERLANRMYIHMIYLILAYFNFFLIFCRREIKRLVDMLDNVV